MEESVLMIQYIEARMRQKGDVASRNAQDVEEPYSCGRAARDTPGVAGEVDRSLEVAATDARV